MAKDIKVALELDNKQFNQGIKQSTTQVNQFGANSKKQMAGVALAVAGATAAFAGLKRGLSVTGEFQDLTSSLTTLFGSVDAGAAAFDRVTDIASKTQFQVQDVTKAFIALKGSGIEPTEDIILTFANAAAITVDQIGSFEAAIRLLSRSFAGGVGLEELNALNDRGVPVFVILKEKLGLAKDEINKFSKEAGNTQKVIDALGEGINEKFGDALANRIENTNQRVSNFNDAIAVLTNNLLTGANESFGELIGNLTNAIKALNENIDGIKAFGKVIGSIGIIAATTFGGRGLLGIFNRINGSARTAASSMKLLGSGIKSITGIGLLTASGKAFGRAFGWIPMATTKLGAFSRILLGLVAGIGGLLQLTGVVIGLKMAFEAYQDVIKARETKLIDAIVGDGRERVEQEIEDLALKVLDLTEAMNLYFETTRFSTRPVGITLGLQAAEIDKLQKRIDTLRASLEDMPESGSGSGGSEKEAEKELSTLDKIAAVTKNIGKNFRSEKQFKVFVQSLRNLKSELLSNEEFQAYEKALKDIEAAFDMEIDPEVVKTRFQELREEISKVQDFEEFDAVLSAINQSFKDGDIDIDAYNKALVLLKGSISDTEAGMAIFQNAIKDIDTAIANDLTNAIFEGENAIESLKATFKEAIKQMIADTIRLMVVQAALQAVFGFFGYSAVFAPSGGISNIEKKAMGGPVMKNKPYIVGEQGPELMVPGSSGSIVPNHALGGAQTTVNYNINAVDAPSFQSLVASDPQFLHAVVTKGANTLPSGRRF